MEIYNLPIIPLIVGVVEVLKRLGLPEKWSALASAIIGIIIGIFYIAPGDILKGILEGLAIGLAATGLYSGTKNTIEIFRSNKAGGK
ncbi:hypothetical protein [Caldanaerobius polysaccharolyticus]|uniref:hypothetical protein n=1 Tax=Caldanaerobius polysaccharolyticus TaxID=44256 RepID=UPI00047E72CE|nr:hypothetical protein [Caldanaerobius polysaccharolyticus]